MNEETVLREGLMLESDKSKVKSEIVEQSKAKSAALIRSLLCPGCGAAYVGRIAFGFLVYLGTLSIAPALISLALWPSRNTVLLLFTSIGVGLGLWAVEQVSIQFLKPRTDSSSFHYRSFVVATCLLFTSIIFSALFAFFSFGLFDVTGLGMKPVLEEGDRVVYHRRIDTSLFRPGTAIAFHPSNRSERSGNNEIVVARILARPGDKIAIKDFRFVVNGVGNKQIGNVGSSEIIVSVPQSPDFIVVPDDSFFVVEDSVYGGYDTRVLDWVAKKDIVSTRMWFFSLRGFGTLVE